MNGRQSQLNLDVPMQRAIRMLPIEEIAPLESERAAMRLCMDAFNRNREDKLEDHQFASLLDIKKGLLSEYLTGKSVKPKHIPEKIRRKIQRLTGYCAIDQYHAYQEGNKLTPIDDNDQLRLKDVEVQRLRAELAKAKQGRGNE